MKRRNLFQTLLAGIVGVKVAPAVIQAAPVLDPAFKVGGDVACLRFAGPSEKMRYLYLRGMMSGEFSKSADIHFPPVDHATALKKNFGNHILDGWEERTPTL
jgi:hypothetical protein